MPNKWLIVNGVKYPEKESSASMVQEPLKIHSVCEVSKSFSWFGQEYEEVCEISLEQALEFQKWVKGNKDL